MEKADTLSKQMKCGFHANPGWVGRFKLRHGISFKSICEGSNKVSHGMTSNWVDSILPFIFQECNQKDIFNADEA